MKRIALATCSAYPKLTSSDELLAEQLGELGIEAIAAPWDDSQANWASFDAVILRSTWNYHHFHNQFRDWVLQLNSENLQLINPHDVVLWNMDKIYLEELMARDLPVVPTYWVECGSPQSLHELLKAQDWQRAIVKPRIGASADFVMIVDLGSAHQHQAQFEQLISHHNLMVQPLVEEIRNGEWSLMFIHNEFSHAVLKHPEDIFVQAEHGGTWHHEVPSGALIESASEILNAAQSITQQASFLYSRVDGVEINGQFVLMELELIEPELFLSAAPQAARKLAAELAQVI